MSTHEWQKVEPGRYATAYLGHVLEVVRNPEFPHIDERRYLAVVDHRPLEPKSWLNGAKTAAIQHVQRKLGREKAERVFRKTEETPPPPAIQEGVFEEVFDPIALPAPEPEPEPAPDRPRITATLTATITDPDALRALNAIKSTLELMREHADVTCTVNLPPTLEL